MIFYEVESEKAFTSKIGELVWMMNHVRSVTVEEVRYLTVEALDQREDGGNSIGALLLHTAAIEYVHQVISFEHRDLNEKEAEQWGLRSPLGKMQQRPFIRGPLPFISNSWRTSAAAHWKG